MTVGIDKVNSAQKIFTIF